jgi:dimethylaniline monooxygenase (N-oxide forming)
MKEKELALRGRRQLNVAVIGAGPSGLVAAKELQQEGHRVTCFEKTDSVGGIFRYRADPESIGVWESCRLTSSQLVTSFSDFFPGSSGGVRYEHRHWRHDEYVQYLTQYAEAFDVMRHVRLSCPVTAVERIGEGWRVRGRAAQGGEFEERFDAVAVCTGVHQKVHTPRLPGQEGFRGEIVHGSTYKNPAPFVGKSVVFVGAGESGGDILAEVAPVSSACALSLRRGVNVIPRMISGLPNDYTGFRIAYSLPEFVIRRSDARSRRRLQLMSLVLLPNLLLLLWHLAESFLQRRKEDETTRRMHQLIGDLWGAAGGNQFENFATKTDAFVRVIAEGRCELRPAVRELKESSVVFDDGTETSADVIVLCTGFEKPSVSFLKEAVELEALYKNCFHPETGATLCFIGLARPSVGAIPPIAEMQARWFAQLCSGTATLPAADAMRDEVRLDLRTREERRGKVFGRLPFLVDFSTMMDELAEKIGCKPRARDFLTRPVLLYKLYTMAFSGAQYRFRGPHARPELAEEIVMQSKTPFSRIFAAVTAMDLILAKGLYAIGLRSFRPMLALDGRAKGTLRNERTGTAPARRRWGQRTESTREEGAGYGDDRGRSNLRTAARR